MLVTARTWWPKLVPWGKARTLIARNLVGKAHHLVLTIFLIITLFLGLNEPSIIEKAKKSRRGVHKMGECVMCGKENETRRLVNG